MYSSCNRPFPNMCFNNNFEYALPSRLVVLFQKSTNDARILKGVHASTSCPSLAYVEMLLYPSYSEIHSSRLERHDPSKYEREVFNAVSIPNMIVQAFARLWVLLFLV